MTPHHDPAPPSDGTPAGAAALTRSVARVLTADDRTAGTAFLAARDTVVTCAHVIEAAGGAPGGQVRLEFPHLPGAVRTVARVQEAGWRSPDTQDIAVLRLEEPPAGSGPLPLGSAEGCRGRRLRSFGFPARSPDGGRYGFCTTGDLLPGDDASALLQLTDANGLTSGFSGAPVVDESTGLVVGMVTAITPQDSYLRGLDIAYATPVRTLRAAWPQLTESRISPYRGLEPFTEEHARFFHGRGTALEEALAVLERQRRVVLLLGPSGAGKSSLVRAGLLPALAEGRLPGSDRWLPVTARPGQDLLGELEAAGLPGAATEGMARAVRRRLAAEHPAARLLLVIDQFEELLTGTAADASAPDGASADVLRQLVAVIESDSAVSLVLVLRDDCFARLAAAAPDLLKAVTPGLLNVRATLDVPELRAVVTEPARAAGAHLEEGLAERIVSDVLAADPGAAAGRTASATLLPALQLTLSRLWEDRRDGRLTHGAYQRLGGVAGSLTAWCDQAVRGLGPDLRLVAERVLTALVRPADETHAVPATRRQVPLDHLRALAAGPAGGRAETGRDGDRDFDLVLGLLLERRIITTRVAPGADRDPARVRAELVHDALIRDWGTLRDWVAADQDFQSWLHRTAERQARFVDTTGRSTGKAGVPDPGDLLDGTDLTTGLGWAAQRGLPEGIADFVAASAGRRRAVARRARRIRILLVCVLALAVIASGLFLRQRGAAADQARASAALDLVKKAEELRVTDPRLALRMGLAAFRLDEEDPTVRASLLETLTTSGHTSTLDGLGTVPTALAVSPDGSTLAVGGGDGSLRFWDVSRPEQPALMRKFAGEAGSDAVGALAWRPDGRFLASMNSRKLTLWEAGRRTEPERLGSAPAFDAPVTAAEWSADGHRLAVADPVSTSLLDIHAEPGEVVTLSRTARIRHGGDPSERSDRLALSADGGLLVTADGADSVQLWDSKGPRPRKLGAALPLPRDLYGVTSVALSPDGRTLAIGTPSAHVSVWNVQDPGHPKELQDTTASVNVGLFSPVTTVEFVEDGVLACAGDDGRVQLVRLDTLPFQRTDMPLVHGAAVRTMTADVSHHLLVTGGADGRVTLWNTADRDRPRPLRPPLPGHAAGSVSGELTAAGNLLASSATDGRTLLWDVGRPTRPEPLTTVTSPGSALSPDAELLASTGGERPTDVVLRSTHGGEVRGPGGPLRGHRSVPRALGWSPDGSLLATGDFDGKVILWDTSDPARVVRHVELTQPAGLRTVAFAGSARTLLTVGTDGRARFWDVPAASGRPTQTSSTDIGQLGSDRSSFALSADGDLLVVGNSTAVLSLWDVSDRRRPRLLSRIATGHDGPVGAVAVSPDASVLAAGIGIGTLLFWDLTDPARPRRMGPARYHRLPMPVAMTFLHDGRTLASQSITQVELWDLSPALSARSDLPRRACARLAGEGLSESAWQKYANGTEYREGC
ncbi:trypsin-like peptidase domain-containing protein [Streptomyces asoensis]|uniref:nSTAND1 domain-containing NTPase n=1 Tax=Streptomyces asoensis TaxID=249586 RepID=UPI0033F39952